MDKTHTTIRIWKETRRKLKLLAALLDVSIVEVLNTIVDNKLKEVGYEDKRPH